MTAEEIIKLLDLKPLTVEGGYYRETYRSEELIQAAALPQRYGKDKSYCTAIYYLLTPDTCSVLHRVLSDEIFHYHLGDPITMLQLLPDGKSKLITLGTDIAAGQSVQVIVPKGIWQGAFLAEGGKFALMGTTVAPGFDFSDYEAGDRMSLSEQYPDRKELITRLTVPAETRKQD